MQLDITIQQKGEQFQATCSSLNIHAFGDTQARAVVRLKLILQFYMETATEFGYNVDGQDDIARFLNGQRPASPQGSPDLLAERGHKLH